MRETASGDGVRGEGAVSRSSGETSTAQWSRSLRNDTQHSLRIDPAPERDDAGAARQLLEPTVACLVDAEHEIRQVRGPQAGQLQLQVATGPEADDLEEPAAAVASP